MYRERERVDAQADSGCCHLTCVVDRGPALSIRLRNGSWATHVLSLDPMHPLPTAPIAPAAGLMLFVGPSSCLPASPPRLTHNSRRRPPPAATRPRISLLSVASPLRPSAARLNPRLRLRLRLRRLFTPRPRRARTRRASLPRPRPPTHPTLSPLSSHTHTHDGAQIARQVARSQEQGASLARRRARVHRVAAREWEAPRCAGPRAAAHKAVQAGHCCAARNTQVPEDDGLAAAEAAVPETGGSYSTFEEDESIVPKLSG